MLSPRFEFGPWQLVHVSSVAATPPWLTPVAKLTLSWQEPQVSLFTVKRQLLACGVLVSVSVWQVVQLRWSCPGAVSATLRISYWNFPLASATGSTCAAGTWSWPPCRLEFGPWQVMQVSSVAATPAWFSPVSKFVVSWQEPQLSRFTVSRQFDACGVSESLSRWQVWQLRMSCV